MVQVSARTWAKIGKVEKSKQKLAIKIIKEGNGFSERDLAVIVRKQCSENEQRIEMMFKEAIEKVKKISDSEKIELFETIYIENINFFFKCYISFIIEKTYTSFKVITYLFNI